METGRRAGASLWQTGKKIYGSVPLFYGRGRESSATMLPDWCTGWPVWIGTSYRGRRGVRMCVINGRDAAAGTASRGRRMYLAPVYSEAPKRNA